MSLFITSSKLTIFLTILVFVLTGNALTAQQVSLITLFYSIYTYQMIFKRKGVFDRRSIRRCPYSYDFLVPDSYCNGGWGKGLS